MAKAIARITEDFQDFIETLKEHYETQKEEPFSEKAFQWFRPKDGEKFKTDDLDALSRQLSNPPPDSQVGNQGDYALIMTQTDMIVTVNRAYGDRRTSRLQCFEQGRNVQNNLDGLESIMLSLQGIQKRSNSDMV